MGRFITGFQPWWRWQQCHTGAGVCTCVCAPDGIVLLTHFQPSDHDAPRVQLCHRLTSALCTSASLMTTVSPPRLPRLAPCRFLSPRPLLFHPVLFISLICLQLTLGRLGSLSVPLVAPSSWRFRGKRVMTVVLAVDGEVTLAGAPSRLNATVTAMETKEAEERERGRGGGKRSGRSQRLRKKQQKILRNGETEENDAVGYESAPLQMYTHIFRNVVFYNMLLKVNISPPASKQAFISDHLQ